MKKGKCEVGCPDCGGVEGIWVGWAWRKDENGVKKKNIHRRQCQCGRLYSVEDNEEYKKLEGVSNAASR
jgi:hypothetical protein